jgi:antitoxin Phd
MTQSTWSLHKAGTQFSKVVAAAERGDTQVVTKRGRPAVVVLSIEEYERLVAAGKEPRKTFVEHLLSIPKRPPSIPDDEELFPRLDLAPRDVDFE